MNKYRILTVTLLLAVSPLHLPAAEGAAPRASVQRMQALMPGDNEVEVFPTGNEQAVIERFAQKTDELVAGKFSNSLDHAFAVLITKANPKPAAASLAKETVGSLCEEFERQTKSKISAAQRDTWVAGILGTQSFDAVLKNLTARDLKRDLLMKAGVNGMLRASGWDSACVLPPADADELKRMMQVREAPQAERGLLGVKADRWPLMEVIPGAPAAEAGLRNGDVVVAVNGKDVSGARTAADGIRLLQGAAGGIVKLAVNREGKTLSIEVRRTPAAAAMVEARELETNILVIRIPSFEGSGIADTVKRLIHTRATNRQSVVILDLRDNPGGRPEEANGVAGIFLDQKPVMICEFQGGKRIVFQSKAGAVAVPLFLLTNTRTGSGAEVLAMALHDQARATIVGEHTAGALFGKDVAELTGGQTIIFRSDPTLLSPAGHNYSLTGIPPDVTVRDARSKGKDAILVRALEVIREERRENRAVR